MNTVAIVTTSLACALRAPAIPATRAALRLGQICNGSFAHEPAKLDFALEFAIAWSAQHAQPRKDASPWQQVSRIQG